MRAFFVLCLATVAYADKLGYNYQPVGHSDSGLSFTAGGSSASIGGLSASGIHGGIASSGIQGGLGGISGGFGSLGGIGVLSGLSGSNSGFGDSGDVSAPSVGSGSVGPSYSAPAEYEKEFFTYTAPEQEFDDAGGVQEAVNSLKKNLRVVFIKGPENRGLENAVINLAKQAANEKTAIYVLQKQSDIGDLANKLNAVQNQNKQKPEVHFVKYRTPEDAANAQQAIQSQYDQLGGSSQSHDGGVVPVHNFASQAPVQAPAVSAPGNSYLPSSIIRI